MEYRMDHPSLEHIVPHVAQDVGRNKQKQKDI